MSASNPTSTVEPDGPPDESADSRPKRRLNTLAIWLLLLSAISAAALIVGVIALVSDGDSSPSPTSGAPTTAASIAPSMGPSIVTEEELATYADEHGPIYWAGPQDDMQYELSTTNRGDSFVRYLPPDVEAGDEGADYLSVATYSLANGYDLLAAAAERPGAKSFTSTSGALVVSPKDDTSRAYFAFPDVSMQVEVFSPVAGEALKLVSDGTIAPVS